MGKVLHYDFGYNKRVNDRDESIAICPQCDEEGWLIVMNRMDDEERKVVAFECESCGHRVDLEYPIIVSSDAIVKD